MHIQIPDDFDLQKIADSGQCFRWEQAEGFAESPQAFHHVYRIIAGHNCLYISSLGDGRYDLDCPEEEFEGFWRDYFDLDEDYRRIRSRIDPVKDPYLWQASEQGKGIRILRQDPWEMLITSVITQNRNIPAIRRSVELLAACCGEKRIDSAGRDYFTFPEPEAIAGLSEADLKNCRLGYRWKYVQAAAAAVAQGKIDLDQIREADEKRTIAALTQLFGVGDKVASCVSLFGLHHLDAFPVDVWIRRILEREYPDGYPFEKYAPYNGVYQQYMFAYGRSQKDI